MQTPLTRNSSGSARRAGLLIALLAVPALFVGLAAGVPVGATQTVVNPTTDTPNSTNFGQDLDVDGDQMIASHASGAKAYILRRDAAGAWAVEQALTAPANFAPFPNMCFGCGGVTIDGNIAAVAAPNFYDNVRGGVVILFEKVDGTWTYTTHVFAPNYASGRLGELGGSGHPIELDGNFLVAGSGSGGTMYLFERVLSTSWALRGTRYSGSAYTAHVSDGQFLNYYYSGGANCVNVEKFSSAGFSTVQTIPCTSSYAVHAVAGDYMLTNSPVSGAPVKDVWKRADSGQWSKIATLTNPNPVPGSYFDWNHGIGENGVVAVMTGRAQGVLPRFWIFMPTPTGYQMMDYVEGEFNYGKPRFSGSQFIDHGYLYTPQGAKGGIVVWDFDADQDQLAKWDEIAFGTDPTDPDTDDDFWSDGAEFRCGSLGTDALSFPLAGCTGDLPDRFSLAGGPLPALLADGITSVHGPIAGPDADGDFVLDVTESRACGTGAVASALATAGGALGRCVSASNHEIANNPLRNPAGLFASGTGDVDTLVASMDVRELQGTGPNAVSAWEALCMVEDANTPDDGTCTGTGATSVYTPPGL